MTARPRRSGTLLARLALPLLATAAPLLVPSAPIAAQATPLRVGASVNGSLSTGDTLRYSVEAGDDFLFYGEVDQISVDVVVRFLDDEGRTLANWDVSARGPEGLSRVIPDAGTYTIEVTPFEDEEGDFSIRIDLLEAKASDPERLADQLMFAYDRPGGPGGAVRVWRDGRTLFSKTYGLADLTWGIPFEEDTPTNIGSTSKQFTAFAVMLEQAAGHLSLDDDIRTWFPDFPDFGETITVRHILSHTSGLREFLNLYMLTGFGASELDRDDVLRAVERQPALQNSPGDEFNYNNTAFSLAAQIVEKTSGQDFDDYMREHVFAPLGMTHSYVRMTPSTIIPGRSDGYTPGRGGWTAPGDLGGAVGAGGIYASVEDLERWGMNLLSANPTVGTRAMIDEMMTENLLTDGEGSGYGLGLFVDEQRGLRRVHHGGADVSHRSMIVYYPELNAGLTTQSNASTFDSQGTAIELGAAWFGDDMEPEEESAGPPDADATFDAAAYDPADFAPLAGSYTLDPAPQVVARFWYDEDAGTYWTQLTGQQEVEMRPVGPNRFQIVVVDATIQFEDGNPAPGLTLFQNGQEIHATRVESDDAEDESTERWEPDAKALEDFVGRYYSDEIETFYTIRLELPEDEDGAPRLIVNQMWLGDMSMQPGEVDTFVAGPGLTVTFERDRNGHVIGLYVDAGRSRDVRFQRVR